MFLLVIGTEGFEGHFLLVFHRCAVLKRQWPAYISRARKSPCVPNKSITHWNTNLWMTLNSFMVVQCLIITPVNMHLEQNASLWVNVRLKVTYFWDTHSLLHSLKRSQFSDFNTWQHTFHKCGYDLASKQYKFCCLTDGGGGKKLRADKVNIYCHRKADPKDFLKKILFDIYLGHWLNK